MAHLTGYRHCTLQLHVLRDVRRFLTHDASVLVANALVTSWLDY